MIIQDRVFVIIRVMAEDKAKASIATEEPYYSQNVEEAVMRIVGGTLSDENKKRKQSFDPFTAYMNTPGWDMLDAMHPDFYTAQAPVKGKRRKVESNVDPALSQIYHPPQQLAPPAPSLALPPSPPPPTQPRVSSSVRRSTPPIATPSVWTEGEASGSFTNEEQKAIDDFMDRFCIQQNLSRQQLCDRVWSSERKKDMFWDMVTGVLPHRTRASVYKHVRRTYHVFDVRGKWTPEEDTRLKQLVEEKGSKWKIIGREMERMPEDCRDRWRNYVKCGEGRKENKWTLEEQTRLEKAVAIVSSRDPQAAINWTAVSERMGGTRSRIQCRYKWGKIKKAQGS